MIGQTIEEKISGPLYYFTGTGNSLAVAQALGRRFPGLRLRSMAASAAGRATETGGDAVGFVFPAYYGGLPRVVGTFMRKLEIKGAPYVFCVVTAAFPWSCFALHQVNKILRAKNRKVAAGFYVAMPESFVLKYNTPSAAKQAAIFLDAERRVSDLADAIAKKETPSFRETAFYALMWYPFFIRKLKGYDRHFRTDGRCTACGTCERVCPVGNIALPDGRPRWSGRCELCMACISFCPEKTIQWKTATVGRARYHHPDVSVKDMVRQQKGAEG